MIMRILTFLALLGALAAPAWAQESGWHRTDQTTARLISATTATGSATKVRIGLEFHMQPDWKIYWRSPGDAGLPPQPHWDGSENLKSAAILWPAPHRFSVQGIETLGYKEQVVLPIDVTLAEPGKPLALKADIPYLVCADICVPYTAKLAMTLPAGPANPSPYAHLISRFVAQVPGDGAGQGLAIAGEGALGAVDAKKGTVQLALRATSATPFEAPDLYLEGPVVLAYSKPKVTLSDDRKSALFDISVGGIIDLKGGVDALTKTKLTATLVDGMRSAERPIALTQGGAAPAPDGAVAPVAAPAEAPKTLVAMLLIAVLGGLILNLMPCVLPVLSIKVLGAIGHGGGETRDVRLGFLASALGIFAAFMVMATVLVGLKAAGMAVGWGIQFQQPLFLAAMAVIVAAFACNLFGFYEIALPQAIAHLGATGGHKTGPMGHFLQGALATLLATPCSAPFLGTAIGFALSGGPVEIYAIFCGLSLGLALPYLAVALVPRMATSLPRPGAWMVRLRQLLGLALAGTAAWLVTVIAGILGSTVAGGLAAGLVMLAVALYLTGRGKRLAALRPALPLALAAALIAGTALAPAPAHSPVRADAAFKALWKPFDEAAIPQLVAAGQTVLVDVTADWCITCQVNKRLVLDQAPVRQAIAQGKVVAMMADWTRPDPKIAAYLAKFGRYGIPFNAVYGPAAPGGIALPELLTENAVSEAVSRAGGVRLAEK